MWYEVCVNVIVKPASKSVITGTGNIYRDLDIV